MICRTGPVCAMLRAASLMNDECTVTVSGGAWTIVSTDPAKVAMIRASVPAGVIPEGVASGTFSVKCSDAMHALSRAPEADITVEDGVLSVSSKGFTRSMRLLDPEAPGRFPSLDLPASLMVDADAVRDVMAEFPSKKVQEVRISLDGAGFRAAVGTETDTAVLELPSDELVSAEGEASAMYPLEYWQAFMKVVPRKAVLDIAFGTDYPLMASYTDDGAQVEWMIAPRIESE